VVSVPHGLVGHELDLSSQFQNQRVVKSILGFTNSATNYSNATSVVRTRKNEATASCQIFGDCALLTLTVAPKTMEDLPKELNSFIVEEAANLGLSALVIDAHNSIEGFFNISEAVDSLREAAVTSLKKAVKKKRSSFEIGAATVIPKEFTVKEGLGPGGISVIVTKVGDQKAAYVTIDGNNMMSGLRERILSELRKLGIVDGEVLTTDTHAVCGIVRTARGYYPIGEVMDQSKLINYIRQAASNALDNLETAEASWQTETIPNVNVIGEKRIKELSLVADETAKQAKRLALSLFPMASLLLLLLFTRL
jgi:putative membrane protein